MATGLHGIRACSEHMRNPAYSSLGAVEGHRVNALRKDQIRILPFGEPDQDQRNNTQIHTFPTDYRMWSTI
jgi:hypothetical protein